MASSSGGRSYSRRIIWLFAGVLIAIALYTAGWFALASWLDGRVRETLAAMTGDGQTVECADPEIRGYPFRVGLFCESVRFENAAEATSLSAGRFRTAAQVYDPLRLVAELDGPAQVTAPGLPPLALTWQSLRASSRLSEPLPSRASIETDGFSVTGTDGQTLGSAQRLDAHMRTRDADLDIAWRTVGLRLAPELVEGRALPPLDGEGDVTIANGVALALAQPQSLRGIAGELRGVTLRSGDGAITLAGPVSVDAEGMVDATLQVTIENAAAIGEAAQQAFPEARDEIATALSGLTLLGGAQGKSPPLPVRIAKGEISIGFIRAGTLPPLD